MTKTQPICVSFAFNKSYAPWAGIALFSIMEKVSRPVRAYLCVDTVPDDDVKRKFNALAVQFENLELRWLNMSEHRKNTLSATGHWSQNTFDRLMLDQIIDEPKVIYLDCDMVVLTDIAPLWDFNLKNKALGVVREFHARLSARTSAQGAAYYTALGIAEPEKYFNAGLLVIDLDHCRATGLLNRAYRLCQDRNDLAWLDQDALNIAGMDQATDLPYGWNLQYQEWFRRQCRELSKHERETLINGFSDAKIVHFSGKGKPWHSHRYMSFCGEYIRIWRRSPWADICPPFGPRRHIARLIHWLRSTIRIKLSPKNPYLSLGRWEIIGSIYTQKKGPTHG